MRSRRQVAVVVSLAVLFSAMQASASTEPLSPSDVCIGQASSAIQSSEDQASVGPGGSASIPIGTVGGNFVSSQVSWERAAHLVGSAEDLYVPLTGATKTVTNEAPGEVNATISWTKRLRYFSDPGSFSSSGTMDKALPVTANGNLYARLDFPRGTLGNYTLQLLTPEGSPVATSLETAESFRTIRYSVEDVGTFPSQRDYILRIMHVGTGSGYELNGYWHVSPQVGATLTDASGNKVADSQDVPGQMRRTISFPGASSGDYKLVLSTDQPLYVSVEEFRQVLHFADLEIALMSSTGQLLKSVRSTSGLATLTSHASGGSSAELRVRNHSTDLSAPSVRLFTTLSESGDENGAVASTSLSGGVSKWRPEYQQFTTTSRGNIISTLDWNPAARFNSWVSSIGTLGSWERTIEATAGGDLRAFLSWPAGLAENNLDLYLLDAVTREVLASGTSLTGSSEEVVYKVPDLDSPSSRAFIIQVASNGTNESFTLRAEIPSTPDLDLELYDSSERLVGRAVTGAKPEVLSAADLPAGTYTLKINTNAYPGPRFDITTSSCA